MTSGPRIEEEAALWAVLLKDGPLRAEDQCAFDAWVAADPRHSGALLRAQAIWLDLDRVGAIGAGTAVEDASSPPKGSRRVPLGIAAALVLACAGATAWWAQSIQPQKYVSAVGEVRRVRLEDGSNMVLNTATRAMVDIDRSRRDIRLEEGEGIFEVARDPARPFVVHVGSISIRALGTVFSVRSVDRQVNVTVTEGIVELMDQTRGESSRRRIGANEQATLTEVRQVEVSSLPRQQAERKLAWTDGMVGFDGETLRYAVTEMNRYNHRQIQIDDPALADRSVVGLFRAHDPDNFAATVAAALGAQSISDADGIRIH